jgi:outer membrane immunogenic protein
MKKARIGILAMVVIAGTGPVLAADLPVRTYTKAPALAAQPIYNWTGFYVGGHLGGAFNSNENFAGSSNNNDGRFLGGVQFGGDYQFASNWVVGIEGQYSWLSNNKNSLTFPGVGYNFSYNQRGIGSVAGRVGYTWGPTLLYVKGGYAYSDYSDYLSLNGAPAVFAIGGSHHDGYTVGAGLEYMFAQSWSGKIEYQYYNFGNANFVTPVALAAFGRDRLDEHSLKAGINYHFNWDGSIIARN